LLPLCGDHVSLIDWLIGGFGVFVGLLGK
jgi:hypothetical protein